MKRRGRLGRNRKVVIASTAAAVVGAALLAGPAQNAWAAETLTGISEAYCYKNGSEDNPTRIHLWGVSYRLDTPEATKLSVSYQKQQERWDDATGRYIPEGHFGQAGSPISRDWILDPNLLCAAAGISRFGATVSTLPFTVGDAPSSSDN